MKYQKPELNLLDPAKVAIQGGRKANPIAYDNPPTNTTYVLTMPAYEADE